MLNITNIPSSRVSFIDPRTGLMSREWYRFFLNLFMLTGGGNNPISIEDTLKGPPIQDQSGLFNEVYYQAQLSSQNNQITADDFAYLQNQIESLKTQTAQVTASDLAEVAKDIQALAVQSPRIEPPRSVFGSFYDTTTQTCAAINTGYPIVFSNSDSTSYGVARDTVNTSRIYVYEAGVYNFAFSAQMTKSSASAHYAYIWFSVDGVDTSNSASRIAFQGSNSDLVAAWNFFVPMAANSYFELKWAVDDTDISIIQYAATAFAPAIPSVILTVNKVSL